MRFVLPRSQDFWAGLVFIAFGATALWIGQDYTIGTSRRMGPGYFPAALGAILCAIGLIVAVRGVLAEGAAMPRGALRPFLVLLAVVAFGVLLQPAGLVVATATLIVVSALGGYEFNLREVAMATVVLILFAVVVFIWGLGLQFSIWPQWG